MERAWERTGVVGLLVVGTALFLLLPAAVFETDAVIYAAVGLSGDLLQATDPGHLVFGFLELGAAELGRAFHPPLNPVFVLRYLAIAAALGGVWVFHRWMRAMGAKPHVALGLSAVLLFGYSYWHFALQAEPHLPATFFLIGFGYAAHRFAAQPSMRGAVLATLSLALATLFHQTGILLVPAWIALVLLRAGRRGLVRYVAPSLGAYVVVAILPYLAVAWLLRDLRTPLEFREWILGLSRWGVWGNWSAGMVPATAVGIVRSLVGSHFLLGIGPIRAAALHMFPGASWQDELALAAQVPAGLRGLLIAVEAAVLVALALFSVHAIRRLSRTDRAAWPFATFLGLWIVVNLMFFAWWAPARAEFWIALWVPVLAICSLPVRPGAASPWPRPRWGVLLIGGLVLVNLLGSILPQSRTSVEPETAVLLAVDAVARPGDLLLADRLVGGRVSRYVYTLDQIDLLHADEAADADTAHVAAALAAADEAVDRVEEKGRTAYLIATPFSIDPREIRIYGKILAAIDRRYRLSPPVPVRAGVELRRIERR